MTASGWARLEVVYAAQEMPDPAFEASIGRLGSVDVRLYAGYFRNLGVCEIQHLVNDGCAGELAAAVHAIADFHGAALRELVIIRPGDRGGKDQALVVEFWPPSTLPSSPLARRGAPAVH